MPRSEKDTNILTEVELKTMLALWALGTGTVQHVRWQMDDGKMPATTTVGTLLTILERKGHVTHSKEGRSFVYTPTGSQLAYQRTALEAVCASLFGGSRMAMFDKCMDVFDWPPDDLKNLHEQISSLTPKRTGKSQPNHNRLMN